MEEPHPLPLPGDPATVIPYATPAYAVPSAEVWHEGKTVVSRKNMVFPPRCVKCNSPVIEPPMKRTFYWHHPALLLLVLVNLLVFAIVALIVRQKGILHIYVCPKHRKHRLIGILAGWVLGLGGIAVVIAGVAAGSGALAVLGVIVFLAGMIGALLARLVYPKRIDASFVWLSGCGSEFVQSLPAIPSPTSPALMSMPAHPTP